MRRACILVFVTALAAGPLAAQGRTNLRLAQGQPARYVPPLCNLNLGNSKVDKASKAVKKAQEAKAPKDRSDALADAKMNLLTAMTAENQGNSSAAWYFMARVALLEGDPAGADSAFTKALALAPSCELDIMQYRQNNWAILGQAGVEFQRKGQFDSALVQFRDASLLFRGLPHVLTNMGVMFANKGDEDSAAAYFAKALEIAEKDTALVEDRNAIALNLAVMYQRLKKNAEAIALLHRYLAWKPNETDAQKSLAIAFRGAGMVDSAEAIESAMISRFATMNQDSLDLQDLMSVGVVAFNKARYTDAAAAFGKVSKRTPWAREPRYNLANAWLALGTQAHDSAEALRKIAKANKTPSEALKTQLADTTKLDAQAKEANTNLVTEAAKLVEMEPMSEDALRLLAQGHRLLSATPSPELMKTAERLVGLPFKVDVDEYVPSEAGARLSASAVGLTPQDATGKPIKPAPLTLVFEFVDSTGKAVDSKEAAIPALTDKQKHPIQFEAKGAGIVGWRYRVK